MQAKVITAFQDKNHLEAIYRYGDTFVGSEDRVKELAAAGFVEPISDDKEKPRAARNSRKAKKSE